MLSIRTRYTLSNTNDILGYLAHSGPAELGRNSFQLGVQLFIVVKVCLCVVADALTETFLCIKRAAVSSGWFGGDGDGWFLLSIDPSLYYIVSV